MTASSKAIPIPQPNSSDTPPDDDPYPSESLDIPPPPPSERKIARRRPSVRAAARAFTPDAESPSTVKRRKLGPGGPAADPSSSRHPSDDRPVASSSYPSASSSSSSSRRPEYLGASTSLSARVDIPRPLSPPPALGASTSRRKSNMGPPSEPFVRKTRKSMSRLGLIPADLGGDTEVPLPESETPMIRKNRQLRDDQSRRSSLGMRGQRASSSLGRGEISELFADSGLA